MRVAIFLTQFLPRFVGGTEIATAQLAKRLATRGHDVHVVTGRDPGLPRRSSEDGYLVYRIPRPFIPLIGTGLFWFGAFLHLSLIRPDLVHIQDIGNGVPGLMTKAVLGKPLVVWAQGSDVYSPPLGERVSRWIVTRCDEIVTLSGSMSQVVERRWRRRSTVVPNGVDFSEYGPTAVSHPIPAPDAGTIVYVGGLRAIKGVSFLIAAFAEVKKIRPKARLILVGDGKERAELETQSFQLRLRDSVDFVGRVENSLVKRYLDISDVFAFPSLSEGLPIALLEAMARGLPIVATRVGGVPEVVSDGVNGTLVEPGDKSMLARALLELLENPEMGGAMRDENLSKVRRYSWDRIVTEIEHLYAALLKRRST